MKNNFLDNLLKYMCLKKDKHQESSIFVKQQLKEDMAQVSKLFLH